MTDDKPSNNERSVSYFVRNNAPIITSLDLLNEGDLYINMPEPISLSADVFDVDDPTSESIEMEWVHNGEALPVANVQFNSISVKFLFLRNT